VQLNKNLENKDSTGLKLKKKNYRNLISSIR